MERYEIELRGMTPLLWNRMKRELRDEMKTLKRNEMDEWEDNPKNWLRKAEIRGQKGKYPKNADKVFIPESWLKAMIVNASKHSRIVPHFASSKKETYTRYTQSIIVENGEAVCKVKDLECLCVPVGAQGVGSKTKVWRSRPMLNEWGHKFVIVDPFGRMKEEELAQILDFGGYIEGIGDGRSMNYGRFEVASIKHLKQENR